ncbi:MAG: ABC transporter substrate-binding protein [Cyanobacteria bacterium P01_G01_bin.38]
MDKEDGFTLKVFLAALVCLTAFFLGVAWWARGGFGRDTDQSQLSAQAETLSLQESPVEETQLLEADEPKSGISWGNKILLTDSTNRHKVAGAAAIASGDYAAAIEAFEAAQTADKLDPETLIYLNNARIGTAEAYAIAAVVPAETTPAISTSILRGIAQAQTEVNQAGGIQGKPLRIAIADDKNSSVFAKEIAEKIVQTPEILGVIGHNSAPAATAAASIYGDQLLAMWPNNTVLDPASLNQDMLPTLASDPLVAGALAHYVFKLKHRTAGIFYDGRSDRSRRLKSRFETAFSVNGGMLSDQVNLAEPQAAASEEATTDLGALEVLVLFAEKNSLQATSAELKLIPSSPNHQHPHLLGSYELFNPVALDQLGEAADGLILAVPEELYTSSGAPFSAGALAIWGQAIDWRTTTSYNTTQSMISGLRQAPNRASLQQVFTTENKTPPYGVRLLKVEAQPDSATGYQLTSLGFLAKEDIFVPE